MTIDMKEYWAAEAANARMMDTTIWQACEILGLDVNDPDQTRGVFNNLFNKFFDEEMAKA